MSETIERVREQAAREAARIVLEEMPQDAKWVAHPYQLGVIDGATWLASRLTREKIADAITNRPTGQSAADAVLGLLERGDDE